MMKQRDITNRVKKLIELLQEPECSREEILHALWELYWDLLGVKKTETKES